jgi:hypothetical protein
VADALELAGDLSWPLAAAALGEWVAKVSPSWLAIAGSPYLQDTLRERIRGRGAGQAAETAFSSRKQAEAALQTAGGAFAAT